MIGCLCLHGFTGNPYDMLPLITYLRKRTEWKFRVPILPGHGRHSTLKKVQYQDWIQFVEKEWKNLYKSCDKVYVIGYSMGGMLASYLAANYPVEKLVLLSAAAYYTNPKQVAADMKVVMKDLMSGGLRENEVFLRYKRKISETPITATWQFSRLVSNIKPMLPSIKAPTFIAQGEFDGIVPLKSAEYLYKTIGSKHKRLSLVKNSRHDICYCEENTALFSDILNFLRG